MAVSKVILNSTTLMDATTATAAAADITAPKTAMLANGVMTTGTGSGGGISVDDIGVKTALSGAIVYTGATINRRYAFYNYTGITSFSAPNLSSCIENFLQNCTSLESIDCPSLKNTATESFSSNPALLKYHGPLENGASRTFQYDSGMRYFVAPNLKKADGGLLQFCSSLEAADIGTAGVSQSGNVLNGSVFRDNTSLTTLVIRYSNVIGCSNVNNFNGSPFASGGLGGTIYIPKSLYDHLGDGTADDYKAASNWSTIDGYGTITWAKIEGSYYETHYADGTTIPT